MPMLDIQKRHAEVFRIRLGDKAPSGAPQKLTDSMRVTSPNRSVVEAFATVYGGDVSAWEQQWQVYLPVTALPVMILPGQSISQFWELYKKSVCERRCDGYTESLSGQPCKCPEDITVRMQTRGACRPMTRINVVCPEVAVVGAGSLVTHSMIAAETLPQSVAVAEAALSRGLMVPGMLRVIFHQGKTHYGVPQLEIVGVSLAQLETGEIERPVLASAPVAAVSPPAPAIAAPSRPSIPASSGPRRPAEAPPLPGEDAEPVEMADDFDRIAMTKRFEELDPEFRKGAWEKWKAALFPPPPEYPGMTKAQADAAGVMLFEAREMADAAYDRRRKHANAELQKVGIKSDDARHAALKAATEGRTESSAKLSQDDIDAIVSYCATLAAEDSAEAS